MHEMMHAAGFYHEQSRRDRDKYVKILWQNMPKERKVTLNFEKYRLNEASTLGEPYDKQSIMHYGNYAFSMNRQPTIESISNPRETLGQREGFSDIDIKQLRKLYNCDPTEEVVVPKEREKCKDQNDSCAGWRRY